MGKRALIDDTVDQDDHEQRQLSNKAYVVGWICALETEYVAAQAFLDEKHAPPESVATNDNNDYTLGRIGKHNTVIAVLPGGEYGTAAAATVARDMLHSFTNVRIGLMVGIGGGAPNAKHDIRLGDVVVSVPQNGLGGVLQYDFGKEIQDQPFHVTRCLAPPPPVLLTAVSGLRSAYKINALMVQRVARDQDDDDDPTVHYGLIASANRLMKNAELRDQYANQRDILCFEMEAGGLNSHFPCLVIRGICDYADTHKNQKWQGYAAMTAAAYAKDLLRRIPANKLEAEKELSKQVEHARNSFLWLYGIPGCGKTVLSSTAITDLCDDEETSPNLVYFYFNFADVEKRSTEKAVRSLIDQLYRKCTPAQGLLNSFYAPYQKAGGEPSEDALQEILQAMMQECGEVWLVLDGLDECETRSQNAVGGIMPWIQKLREMISLQSDLVAHDIKAYIETQVQQIKRWQAKPDVQRLIATTLRDGANGMFRWVYCQFETIEKCLSLDELRRALASLPPTLDETYARILKRLYPEHKSRAIRLLQLLVYSERPLRLDEAVDAVAVEPASEARFDPANRMPMPQEIVQYCAGLVTLTQMWFLGTALQAASYQGHLDTVNVLLEYGARVNEQGGHYGNALQAASIAGHEAIVRRLMQEGADVNRQSSHYEIKSALIAASKCGHAAIVQMLLEYGADVNAPVPLVHDLYSDNRTMTGSIPTALVAASSQGHGSIVHMLIQAGADAIVRTLIDSGADVNAQGGQSGTALAAAACTGETIIMDILIQRGADVNAQGGHYGNALVAACLGKHEAIIRKLIDGGANINARGGLFGSAIVAASSLGHEATLGMLIESGADVNLQDERYGNALAAASFGGHEAVVRILMKSGADINARGGDYETAITAASSRGHKAIVQMLIEGGADVNIQGGRYGNALALASFGGHEAVVRILMKSGADINSRGGDYETAITAASSRGHKAIVQMLIEGGADVNIQGGFVGNALRAAAIRGNEAIVQLLVDNGAPLATSESSTPPENVAASSSSLKHGSLHREPIGLYRVHSAASSSSRSSSSRPPRDLVDDGVDVDQLDEKLRGLRLRNAKGSRHNKLFASAPGQRIADYENALTPPTPKQALGFKVIKRSAGEPGGTRLTDIPNEILTNILSHLHPDSHGAVALVSKRFYVLATTPHIWRLAFLRYFPGHASLDEKFVKASADLWSEPSSDIVRSETRYFGRLTPLATWRSEYVFRTRLIRSLGKGKPNTAAGAIGSSMRTRQLGKKSSAVLTYNSKLPWLITNIHAVFDNGKKAPRAIQGAGALGVATMSDPTTGKIESWGLKDSHSSAQIEEVTPGLEPYGLGDGPASTDNSMDVSQLYGMIAGEGFPGGRAYFRSVNEIAGRYLGSEPGTEEQRPDIPRVPDIIEAISSVWIAKSSAVPATTAAMCGMLTGSTLGVVTAYSLGSDPSGPRYAYGDMTARWVLSPGVPIVSIKVDDNYTVRRRLSGRVWAVALNALGEVFYLTETPKPVSSQHSTGSALANAWLAGRSAYWHLVEETRRSARPDELDLNAVRGTYSPRTSCNAMNLSDDQVAAETKEIENFMRYQPNHFLDVCLGWDMQRKLEVDFANDDGQEAGEGIFVIDCGHSRKACVTRFCRSTTALRPLAPGGAKPAPAIPLSLFGQAGIQNTPEPQSPKSPPPTPYSPKASSALTDEWRAVSFQLKGSDSSILTASALDNSTFAVLTLGEDVLHTANESLVLSSTDGAHHAQEIPGRRARFLVVGTSSGSVLVWNAREIRPEIVKPCRVIQTESPSISCVAASALYLVHGGSDGLVQAWDHLASTSEPIRTLNARSNGRVPRYMMTMNPTLTVTNYTAVGAIVLDSDPTILRGVVAFGAFMRYWSYSSKGSAPGRKRRLRHPDAQGRTAGRRFGNNVSGYILEEEEELRHENEHRAREQSRLHKRFGVGALGDLTEQEALEYMQMVSEESFLADETRRASDSAADTTGADTASTSSHSTADATTPEASFIESSSLQQNLTTDDEKGFEEQIQQAIRLSLLEGVNDRGQSPQRSSPDEFEFPITYKAKIKGGKKKNGGSRRQSSSTTTSTSTSSPRVLPAVTDKMACVADSSSATGHAPPHSAADVDADLALALCIQEEEEQAQSRRRAREPFSEASQDFPPLAAGQSTSKGKGVTRW
ncbi:hypothetical protein MY8738_001464 [Beauveria namnaoensis]